MRVKKPARVTARVSMGGVDMAPRIAEVGVNLRYPCHNLQGGRRLLDDKKPSSEQTFLHEQPPFVNEDPTSVSGDHWNPAHRGHGNAPSWPLCWWAIPARAPKPFH